MSRTFSQRDYLSGRANTGNHLVPRERPFPEDASEMPGASSLDDQGQRYFADGEDWLADLPGGSEVMIPTWEAVPEGWFEIGNVSGLPAGRRLIGNRFSINYTLTDTLSWAIMAPSNLYTDAARETPVTTPPSPVGGIDDVGDNENHWTQATSVDRPVWEQYARDGETVNAIRATDRGHHIDVPLGGASTGSVIMFTEKTAIYAPCNFEGDDLEWQQPGINIPGADAGAIEEVIFLDRTLTSGEVNELVAAVRKARNRRALNQPLTGSISSEFYKQYWITELPMLDTSGVTSALNAWYGLRNLNSFPAYDLSNCDDFREAWAGCGFTDFPDIPLGTSCAPGSVDMRGAWAKSSLETFPENMDVTTWGNIASAFYDCNMTTFPRLDFANATELCSTNPSASNPRAYGTWARNPLISFPPCDFPLLEDAGDVPEDDDDRKGGWSGCDQMTSFGIEGDDTITFPSLIHAGHAWYGCLSLADFPAGVFDNAQCVNYRNAWVDCALTQQSVDNILVSVAQSLANDTSLTDGRLDITGGTSAAPSATGEAAIDDLRAAGWTVNVNGGY